MKNIAKQLFQDNTGKYVVGQPPNIPVYMILISLLLKSLLPDGPVKQVASVVFQSSVFLWSYLEIVYGESMVRRIFGTVIMLGLLFMASMLY